VTGFGHLFVYGTLLPGEVPEVLRPLLGGLAWVGRGWLPGRLYDLGPYPGAVPDAGAATRVRGEVYALPGDPGLLEVLDAYEGCVPGRPLESLFVRVQAPVALEVGGVLRCWVYAYNRDPGRAPLLADGRYRRGQCGRSADAEPPDALAELLRLAHQEGPWLLAAELGKARGSLHPPAGSLGQLDGEAHAAR
jgi:gamma-glutamylcyclotransferase (GGCT)/AIG2-like uncharacterized protein YtfP